MYQTIYNIFSAYLFIQINFIIVALQKYKGDLVSPTPKNIIAISENTS